MIGRDIMAGTDAYHARLDQRAAQERLARVSQEAAEQNTRNTTQLIEAGQAMTSINERNEKLTQENQKYRELLARPLQDILEENANYKKAYEEQQALIGMWLLAQRAMKKTAIDIAKKSGISPEEVSKQAGQNIDKILSGDNLSGIVEEKNMQYFNRHKNLIMKNLKK